MQVCADWPIFLRFVDYPRKRATYCARRVLFPVLGIAYLCFLAINHSINAQTAASENIVVTGEEITSSYGAPGGFSQSRFSPLTNAYVLPPGAIYASLIYEGDAVHYRSPDHHWTEEIEIGLPYRINVANRERCSEI